MSNLGKKEIIILIIALIILLIVALGVFLYSRGYLDKCKWFKCIPPQSTQVFKILGKIKNIEGDIINIEAYQTYKEITLPDGRKAFSSKLVKVNINNNTQFFKTQSGIQNLPDSQKIPITLSDLKVGEIIETTSNEDIKDKEEILAKTITLLIQ